MVSDFRDIVEQAGTLTELQRETLLRCFIGKGARKGVLRATRPKDSAAFGAWVAIRGTLNPQLIQTYALMTDQETRDSYLEIDGWFSADRKRRALLSLLGQRPYQYNTEAHHVGDWDCAVARGRSIAESMIAGGLL